MVWPTCEFKIIFFLILCSCLDIYECQKTVQKCCPSKYIIGVDVDKSVKCVDSTNITLSSFMNFELGPKETNQSSWEKCDYEIQPITGMNEKQDLFCVDKLTFINRNSTVMPYLAGLRCKNNTVQQNKVMHGVNKCCKLGQMFSKTCTPLGSGMTNVIDQQINQGKIYAASDIYSTYRQYVPLLPVTVEIHEKPISYFESQEYIKDFSKRNPVDYCVEQSENSSKIIVLAITKCSNCVPKCNGFDTYIVAKPDSTEKIGIRSTTWNLNDSYYYIYNFQYLFMQKTLVSMYVENSVCLKGIKKIKKYSQKSRSIDVTYEPYRHTYEYNTDICTGIIYDELLRRDEEYFSCKSSFDNWILFKLIIFSLGFVCTIMTFLVYKYLKSLRNVFGKSLMIFLVCCMGLNVLNLVTYFEVVVIESWYYIGIMKYFFDILKSFWLLLMSYDVWATMRKINVRNRLASAGYGGRRFLSYCFLSFTASIILTIYLIVDDHMKLKEIESSTIEYYSKNVQQEYMNDDNKRNNDKFLNFYVIPTLCVVIINLVFYTHTFIMIHRIKRNSKASKNLMPADRSCFNHFEKFQYQFDLIFKLFLVMGLMWISNIPALLINHAEIDLVTKNTDFLKVIAEILSLLEGIFIFCIFVVKKRIFQQFHERLGTHS